MNDDPPATVACPQCAAENPPTASICRSCRVRLYREETNTATAKRNSRGWLTFGLSSLLWIVALVAVLIGIWQQAPGVANLLAVASGPALLLTLARVALRRCRGQPVSSTERMNLFLGTFLPTFLAVLVVAGVLSVTSFFSGVGKFLEACLGRWQN